jgi:hypothetical protein
MATLAVTHPTLKDFAAALGPDNKIADIVEILNLTNSVLDDMVWVEGNLPTGHRTTVRAGLPQGTWRKLYGGVLPNKGTTVQVTDNTAMLEAYAEVDKALADLNGNTAAFRLSEDRAHIEGMSQQMATALFYGDETLSPEQFTGLAPRFNSTTADNGENIILGGSAGGQTDNLSIWLVGWGENAVHGIIPKGSTAGLQVNDKGQVTLENAPGGPTGGRMEAYRTHYKWDCGLSVRDWRYIVRIPNIDRSLLTMDYSTGANLADLMVQAIERLPNLGSVRPVFYMNRTLMTFRRRQITSTVKNSTLTMETVAGKKVMMFDGIPVKRVDALAADEARVA